MVVGTHHVLLEGERAGVESAAEVVVDDVHLCGVEVGGGVAVCGRVKS